MARPSMIAEVGVAEMIVTPLAAAPFVAPPLGPPEPRATLISAAVTRVVDVIRPSLVAEGRPSKVHSRAAGYDQLPGRSRPASSR